MSIPIVTNNIIQFNSLVDGLVNTIVSLIENKTEAKWNSFPASIKPNYSTTLYARTDVHFPGNILKHISYTCSLDNNTAIYYFESEAMAREQIGLHMTQFFASRGINNVFDPEQNSKHDAKITTKGLLNFYNNFAAYISQTMLLTIGQENPVKRIMFNCQAKNVIRQNITYPTVNVLDDGSDYTTQNINDLLTNLNSILNHYTREHLYKYVYTLNKDW